MNHRGTEAQSVRDLRSVVVVGRKSTPSFSRDPRPETLGVHSPSWLPIPSQYQRRLTPSAYLNSTPETLCLYASVGYLNSRF